MKRFISASLSVCLVLACSGFESLALIQDEDVPQETVELVTDGEEVDSDEASDEAASDEEETAPAEPSETEAATEAEPTETEAEPTESEPVETEAVVTEAPEETEQAQEEETTPAETSESTEEVLPEVTEEKTEEVVSANEEIQSSDIKDEMPVEPVKYIAWDGETKVNVFENELIKVTFTLINTWNGGYSANVKIENLSDANIENWGVAFTSLGELSTLWNGVIESDEDGIIIIKNAEWNQDIPAGGSVDFGLTGKEDFKAFPGEYKILGDICLVEKSEYSVSYSVVSEWEEGFTAGITLTNLSGKQIEDWTLEFDYDREIAEIWNAEIVSHIDNHYVIKNAGHNANIRTGKSVTFGFNGKDGSSEDIPTGFKLTYITTDAAKPTSKPTVKPTVKPSITPTPAVTEEPVVTEVPVEPVVLPRVAVGYTDGDSQYNVKHNLILPTEVDGATVSWTSSNDSIVSSTGVVNRPYDESVLVTLTATITKGESTSEKTFEVRVIKDMYDYVSPDEIMILDEDIQLYYYNPVVADLKIYKNDNGYIKRVQGSVSDLLIDSPDEAMLAIYGVQKLLGMENAYDELISERVAKNSESYVFVFKQVHNGVPVLGSSVSLTTDMSGNAISLLSSYKPIDISTDANISKDSAIASVSGLAECKEVQLNIMFEGDAAKLVWSIYYISSSNEPWLAYVDAVDGSVISNSCTITYSDSERFVEGTTDSGTDGDGTFPVIKRTEDDQYYLQDTYRGIIVCTYTGAMGETPTVCSPDFDPIEANMIFSSSKTSWDQVNTNPYRNTISILDHYKRLKSDVMGTDAFFYIFTGMNQAQSYHVASGGVHYMVYGVENNQHWGNNPKTVGHEFSHGIVSANTGLYPSSEYSQARAIDEAYADMFSYLWLNTDDWSISFPNGDRRSSVNPIADGIPNRVPANFDDYQNGLCEDHYASTMISHIGYNLKAAGMGQQALELFLLETLPSIEAGASFADLKDIWLTVAENRNLRTEYIQIIIDSFEAIGFPTEDPEDYLSSSYATGKVREADTTLSGLIHYDLENVNISVERVGDSSFSVNPTVSDADGVYRFSQLLPGKYKFTYTKNGYVAGTLQYSVFNTGSNYIDNMDLIKVVNTGEATTGFARGKVMDSVTGNAIPGMLIRVRNGWGNTSVTSPVVTTLTTNSSGIYELRDLPYGYYTLEVYDQRTGVSYSDKYKTAFKNVVVFGNNRTASGQDIPVSNRITSNQMRIVLEWDAAPSDLHSTLLGSTNRFTVAWNNRFYPSYSTSGMYVSLDHDDVDGNGPETTTIFSFTEEEYEFYVYQWTNSGTLSDSNATVKVYFGYKTVPTYVFNVPRSGTGRYWDVFKYDHDDGENLEPIDVITNTQPTLW